MLDKAIRIASEAFEGVYDKGGQPYILHCLYVMNQMCENDYELRSIAVMHDLIEDTEWTIGDLYNEGFSDRVVQGVMTMTHLIDESYEDYIKRISCNDDARRVKMADLKHNSDITRLKGVRKKDFARLEKYSKAYLYLSE